METIEIQASSLESAKILAAEKLGVAPSAVDLTLIEEIKGLFGKSTVKVRATVSEAPRKGDKAATKTTPKPKPVKEKQATQEKSPERKEGRKASVKSKPKVEVVAKTSEPEVETDEEEQDAVEVIASESDAEEAAAVVREILHQANLEGEVRIQGLNGRYINLELDGRDVAYLVGKHGEVLNAFQYLVNVMMARLHPGGARVTLDGNHYRDRREQALTKLAEQIADQVRVRGEEAVLDALPAFERRVVHRALQEFEGVQTYSEGEEPNRRVVIAPG